MTPFSFGTSAGHSAQTLLRAQTLSTEDQRIDLEYAHTELCWEHIVIAMAGYAPHRRLY